MVIAYINVMNNHLTIGGIMNDYKYLVYLDFDSERIYWVRAESVQDAEKRIENFINNQPLVLGAELIGAKLNG